MPIKHILMFAIGVYQALISPVIGPRCRFYPSCSDYARTAIGRFGTIQGGWLAVKRLAKCHPFHPGGVDPVPRAEENEIPPFCSQMRGHG